MTDITNNTLTLSPSDQTCDILDFGCHFDWLILQLSRLFLWIWDGILSGMASVINAIPLPDFVNNISSLSIPPSVSWALEPFMVDFAIQLIIGAYITRFIIRRLPFVG